MVILTQEREARGWTRTELGRRARLHPSRIGQVELEHVVPYEVELRRLARELDWKGDPRGLLAPVAEAGSPT